MLWYKMEFISVYLTASLQVHVAKKKKEQIITPPLPCLPAARRSDQEILEEIKNCVAKSL